MAAITFSVKLDTDKDEVLIAKLEASKSRSYVIKAALYHYFEMPPPPPPAEPGQPLPPPPPASPFDYDEFESRMFNAMKRALGEAQIAVPSEAPYNEFREPAPVKSKKDALLEDILGGIADWKSGH